MIRSFIVPIEPKSWQRAGVQLIRPKAVGARPFVKHFTPTRTVQTETAILEYSIEHLPSKPITGPVSISMLFVMRRPKDYDPIDRSWPARPGSRINPDLDNMAKAVLDALNKRAFVDDAQVVDLRLRKVFSAIDEKPHIQITISDEPERLNHD